MNEGLIAEIRQRGALSVADYMTLVLTHPEHGYYRRRTVLGAAGDFVTAPEISQVFGELIGLWCLAVWDGMGRPAPWRLIELGPGRGTLMRDVLRALTVLPQSRAGLTVDLVEISPVLRGQQHSVLADAGVPLRWFESIPSATVPTVLVANEFLDALPVSQWLRCGDGWHERHVTFGADGALAFRTAQTPSLPPGLPAAAAADGDVFEYRADFVPVCRALADLGRNAPLAGLFIDYGHAASGYGDTLQAVKAQGYRPPLADPGMADLTAQVDFQAFAAAASAAGLAASPLMTQAEFLGRLGIVERTAALLRKADTRQRGLLESGTARLISPDAMGTRFKVIGLASSGLTLPVFSPTG